MEAHEYYEKETGKLYYKEAALELELTDDYINWLERNVVKLFAIPVVSGSLGFDEGYKQGYDNATSEACQEIAKNYQPNDR